MVIKNVLFSSFTVHEVRTFESLPVLFIRKLAAPWWRSTLTTVDPTGTARQPSAGQGDNCGCAEQHAGCRVASSKRRKRGHAPACPGQHRTAHKTGVSCVGRLSSFLPYKCSTIAGQFGRIRRGLSAHLRLESE